MADINREGRTRVKLTGVIRIWTENTGRGSRSAVIVEVIVGSAKGARRDYFLGIGRPDFIGAKKQLGANLGAWSGKILEVTPDRTGQYVNVHDEDRPQNAGGPAAPTGPADADDIPF